MSAESTTPTFAPETHRRWVAVLVVLYVAVVLGVTHFWWQVKADWREPAAYALVLAVLFGWRIRRARRRARASRVVS